MRILITGPRLDEQRNVSGIVTVVGQIIEHGRDDYLHFVAGREDGERAGAGWILKQFLMPIKFFLSILRFRPDLVHLNTALTELAILRDATLAIAAKVSGRPLLVAVHGGKYLVDEATSWWIRTAARVLFNCAGTVVVLSDHEKLLIRKQWPHPNIHSLPNAIPPGLITNPGRENETPLVVYLGRMHESKGLVELIGAVTSLKSSNLQFQLEAYGQGPMRDEFVAEVTNLLGDAFYYGGVVAGERKWEILRRTDIFILPSRYGEGLPMAMLEAMGSGCIVVVSNVASVSSVVIDGDNGFLVEPSDTVGLVSKLRHVFGRRSEWPAIREQAVATVRINFELNSYLSRLGDIYKKTIAARKRRP